MALKLIVGLLLSCNILLASKVMSASSGDWKNPQSWKGFVVPLNPDTIIIKHYISFTSSLVIAAPTVLIIEQEGTLCGHFFLDITCGARLINFGQLFIHGGNIRDGENRNSFISDAVLTIFGCPQPGFGKGFSNLKPGFLHVGPTFTCSGTPWFSDAVDLADQSLEGFSIFPNPSSSGIFSVQCTRPLKARVFDLRGHEVFDQDLVSEMVIDLRDYPTGIYVLVLNSDGINYAKKIIKE